MSGPKQEGAAAPSHTDLPCTVEHALDALDGIVGNDYGPAGRLLDALAAMCARADLEGDTCLILEAAYQSGFKLLDNEGDLLVVSERDLVAFVKNRDKWAEIGALIADGDPDQGAQ